MSVPLEPKVEDRLRELGEVDLLVILFGGVALPSPSLSASRAGTS